MLPDRVSNPGPLTYESGALPTALHGPSFFFVHQIVCQYKESKKVKVASAIFMTFTRSMQNALQHECSSSASLFPNKKFTSCFEGLRAINFMKFVD